MKSVVTKVEFSEEMPQVFTGNPETWPVGNYKYYPSNCHSAWYIHVSGGNGAGKEAFIIVEGGNLARTTNSYFGEGKYVRINGPMTITLGE